MADFPILVPRRGWVGGADSIKLDKSKPADEARREMFLKLAELDIDVLWCATVLRGVAAPFRDLNIDAARCGSSWTLLYW
jgi:hypothetical protein